MSFNLRPCIVITTALMICMLLCSALHAREYRLSAEDEKQVTEQFLQWQDRMVLMQFSHLYPRDFRYDQLLYSISCRFNKAGPLVYEDFNKEVYFAVFASSMGFNACTWHRVVIFDSLLMDSFRRLSEGIALYGGIDNPYCASLAHQVVKVGAIHQFGMISGNFSDLRNPFALPSVEELTAEEKRRAMKVFESIIAAVTAHEASHAFLNHIRERIETQRALLLYNQGKADPQELNAYINNYINVRLSQEKEFEADTYGALLAKEAGYQQEGFIYWLEFTGMLEKLTGTGESDSRSHPITEDRIRNIRKVWEEGR